MLNIIIDGKRAAIKKNISFDYVAENRRFTKSDSYTLEISFPIKDCSQNINIFGDLSRKDASPKKLMFDCELIDRNFHKKGTVIITQFSDVEVKCQFLEGRSGSMLTSTIEVIYINEIEIASPSTAKSQISPSNAWSQTKECVALPWVHDDSGNIQNKVEYEDDTYKWSKDTYQLSWFPYLTTVIKKICSFIGYSCDISKIENDEALKYLLVCNALPGGWYVPEVARALPHWTIKEFFEKLEDFLMGEFVIDHTEKSVVYISPQDLSGSEQMVVISSDINDFEAEVFVKDSECSAIDIANVKYKKSDHRLQQFWDCNSAVSSLRTSDMVLEFDSLSDLVQKINEKFWINADGHRNMNQNKLYYVKADKKYFCMTNFYHDPESNRDALGLQNVNDFGERLVSTDEDAKTIELEFVPARIDYTDFTYGFTLFCAPGSFSENSTTYNSYQSLEERVSNSTVPEGVGNIRHQGALATIRQDEFNMQKSEYYDRIYLGWWNGEIQFDDGSNPFPNIADVLAVSINSVKRFPFSLSLTAEDSPLTIYSRRIDTSARYHISFISDSLPSPRAIFLIRGKKYVCEKLTAKFTDRGMSSLIKGEFWRLRD